MDRAQSAPTIRIDARPAGPSGPMASHIVLGRPTLHHAIEAAESAAPGGRIILHAFAKDVPALASLVPDRVRPRVSIWVAAPEEAQATIRTDRLYDSARLRKAL